jgi:hypothetical protein
MRFRTVALALALSCGLMSLADAKQKPAVHKVKQRKFKGQKNPKIKVHRAKPTKRKIKK